MEISAEIVPTPPRDSSTVIILRDGPGGLEVFLVKRHGQSEVLGGAFVFPGGKLDETDCQFDESRFGDQSATHLHSALGEPDISEQVAKGLYVAAAREAFEESGVLFAEGASESHRAALARQLKDGRMFNIALEASGLRLQTRAMYPWSRWITPKMHAFGTKRFDTRFFLAALPPGQTASHDNVETIHSVWMTPRAALQQYWERSMEMAPPQIMTLAHLSHFTDVQSALLAAHSAPPPLILPEPLDQVNERLLAYPGDPLHSVKTRAMLGPTRLRYRNKRFEPEQGFEALFD